MAPKLTRDTIGRKVKTPADIIPALLGRPTPTSIAAWRPPIEHDVPAVRDWRGPWKNRVDHLPLDEDRTARLAEWDVAIDTSSSVVPWEGSVSGQPHNTLRGGEKMWDVLIKSRPVRLEGGKLVPPVERVPLPDVIARQGDPMGSSDMHTTIIDPVAGRVYDMILFDRNLIGPDWCCGYDGGGAGLYVYNINVPYDGKQGGTCAGNAPKFPLILTYDEVERALVDPDDEIDHTSFFALANYSDERPTGWAKGTDGTWKGHPIRAGEILRLRPEIVESFKVGTPQRVVANALGRYGMWCGDKSTHGDPRAKGGGITKTMDIRWSNFGDMGLRLTHFEVVAQD